jgi:hypothetical protein
MNTSDETSSIKVLHSTLYKYVIPQIIVSLQIIVIGLYCTLSKDIIHQL